MRVAGLLLLIVGAVALSMCGSDSPPAPTPITTTTTLPPTTTTVAAAKSCTLSAMPDCAAGCCKEGGTRLFDAEILAAQDAVRTEKAEWFRSNGSLRVTTVEYTTEVAKKITEMFGLCARGGDDLNPNRGGHSISSDEVGIKRDNGLSQNVDIVLGASNSPHLGKVHTCKPAAF